MVDFDDRGATVGGTSGAGACEGEIFEAAQNGVRIGAAFQVVQARILIRGCFDFWELLGVLVDVQLGAKGVVVESHVSGASCSCF